MSNVHPQVLLINGGGIRSLVASAMLAEKPALAMVYLHDGRPADPMFELAFGRQADRYVAASRSEITVEVCPGGHAEPGSDIGSALAPLRYLAAAANLALEMKIERLIWPVVVSHDVDAAARAIEVVQLLEQAVRLDQHSSLRIEMPLLEFTPRQLLEVGQQMQAPWELARSCLNAAPEPCGDCAGCRWRYEAFQAAGIEDPIHLHPAGR